MSEAQTHPEDHKSHGIRHTTMMLLCCLLPIAAIFALNLFFPGNVYLRFAAVAICPLSMIFMHLPDLFSKTKKKNQQNSCH